MNWVPGNTESAWQMEYSTNGATWTPEGSVTAPYTLSTLTPNTEYYIRLRSDCGGGDYSSWTSVRAHTPCAAATLPLTEDFDAAVGSTTGNMVDCWGTLTSYTSAYPYASTSYHHSGTHSVYFYGPTPHYSYLISPRLDDAVQMNNLEVSFWAYKTSASYFIQVGVMSDPDDPNTFVQIGQDISPSATSTWELFDVSTAIYTGQGKYIAFRVPGDVSSYMYVDDVNIHELPTCPHVTNIHTTAVSSTSANVTWTAGGTEQEWIVVSGPAGTIVDPDYELATASTVYTPSFTLNNLNGGTSYDVYVKAVCSTSDSSMWMQYSFRTDCGYITHLPYTENFETFTSGSGSAISCWTRNGLYSPTTYPYVNTSYSTSGTKSLYFYCLTNSTYSTYSSIYSSIALPPMDPTIPVNTLQVSFKMRPSSTAAKLIVGVMTNPSDMTTFTPVQTITPTAASVFEPYEVELSSYTGTGSYIALKTNFTSNYNIYLDDINISLIPTCKHPVNVEVTSTTTNSATISWTPRSGENNWQVVVVPHGQPVTNGTPEYATQYPYTVQNLTDATMYDVYVKADCGNNDMSDWSDPVKFHTKCFPTSTIPYFESFEGVGSGSGTMPICWTAKTDYVSTTEYPYVSTSYHSQGSTALYFYKPAANYMYATSQALDLSNYSGGDLAISYKLLTSSSLSYARMDVGIMTDPDDPSTFTCLRSHYTDEFAALNTWYSFSVPLNETYSTPVYVAFYAPVSTVMTYMYVDEVMVAATPLCSAPTNLTFSQISGASVMVSWLDSQYGDGSYTVEYTSDNVTWNTEVVTGTHVMLTGLTQQTPYHVRVYRNCSNGTPEVATGMFTTSCYSSSDVEFTDGAATTYYIPVYNSSSYKYSYSQQIFLASELGGTPMDIKSIAFEYKYATALTSRSNVNIYLGHTTKSTFSSTTDWVPYSDLQLVYSGNLNCTMGWNTFVFNSVFHYNGTSNLVVVVDDNSNAASSTSYVFAYKTQSPNYRTMYHYNESTNPNPQSPPTASSRSYYRNNIKFLTVCDSTVTCYKPNAYISDRDHESIEVTWAPGGSESSWELEYKADNDVNWTQVPGATSPQIITGLTSNTLYDIRLRSDCGGGDYSVWRELTAETECAAITVPYMQNFDSTTAATGAMVPCWTRNTNNSTAYPYLYASYSESSPNSVYFYTTSAYYAYLASPRFDDGTRMDSLLVRFKARRNSVSSPHFIEVGIMTDPNDYSTFTAVGTFAPSGNTLDFENAEIRTSGYTGNGKYVAFRSPRITNYMYLDDVQIDYIPNCLHAENVHAVASSITATSADVIWTPGGDEVEWNVVVAPAGSVTNPNLETPQTIYGTPTISLANLTGNTPYEVFVQGHCNNGENSVWEVGTFRTACVAISTLPFTENFDSYAGSTTTSVSVNNLPSCWDNYNHGTSTSYSGYPIIYNSSSSAASGSNAMRFYTYTTAGTYDDQVAILPLVDVTTLPLNTLKLSFDARANSTSYTFQLVIGVMTNPSDMNTFVPVDTINTSSTSYAHYGVLLDQYTGTGSYIAMRAPQPTSGYNYGYVDNILLDVAPSCSNPTSFQVSNLTPTSADFSWTDDVMESTWQLLVVPANQTPDFTQAQTVTSNFYSLSTLNVNTRYNAYLRTVCSNGLGYSEWISTSFKTPCQAFTTLPFIENFDSYAGATTTSVSENNLPSCWANYNHGTSTSYSGYPIIYNSSSYAASGSNAMRFYTYTTAGTYDDQVAILPPIDATVNPWSNLMMSFDARALNTSYAFELVVGVMSNPSDMTTFVPVQTISSTSTAYASYEISFAQYTGSGNFIAIKAPKPASGYNYGYVDNIIVDVAPSCSPVRNLTVSQVAATSALLSWDDGMFGTPSSYTVEYAVHGTNNWTPASYSVTASPYMLGGLTLNTNYDVRVKANCTDGSSSNYWATAQFATPACLVEREIQIGNGTTTSYYLPVNNYYHFTYSQQIYLASEMGGAGTLRSVSFEYAYSDGSRKPEVSIYLGHTTKSTFTSTTDYIAISGMTLVYRGPLDCQQGWNTFVFQTPFQYNGTSNLVMAIDDNSDGYSGSAYVFKVHSTSPNYRSIYYYSDSTDPDPSNPPTASSYSSGNRSNVKFGGGCDNNATCVAPNVYVRDVTTTTATIDWAPGYTESQWSLEYQVDGAATWTTAGTQTSSPATLTGLTPGTPYKVRMRSECGGNDVSDWVVKEFSTECLPIAQLPFTENFDSYSGSTSTSASSNNLPLCWNYLNNGTSTTYSGYPIIYSSTASAYSGSNSIRFYTYITAGTYDDQIAILPKVDVSTNAMSTLQLSFDARNNSSYTFELVVGVMTDPTNKSTFVPIDTIVTTSNTYASYDVLFDQYSGTGEYIALMAPRPASSYNSGYVDNIRLDLIPSCPRPHDLAVTTVTQSDVTLTWTEMGSAYNWVVEYGSAGYTQGTGTTVQVQNTPTTTITGLAANTAYDFYVKSDCGGGDMSIWSTKASARTACNAVTIPYSENFDNMGSGSGVLPSCWSGKNDYSTTTLYPYINTSYHYSGNASLYFYCSTSTYNIAVLPFVDVTANPINTLQLSFMMRSTSSTTSTITVGVITNPLDETSFTPITTVNNTTTGAFEPKEVSLSSYTGQGAYVALKLTNTSGTYSVYIDDILLETIPTCPKPQNLTVSSSTQNSVTLSWTETGTAHDWIVEYGPAGYMQGTGTTVQVHNTPTTTITGLSASTTYDFYVQADCGSGDVSSWSIKATGATQCAAISQLPYTENFDSYGTGTTAYPNCWSKINTYSSGDRPYCHSSYAYNGSTAGLYFFTTGTMYNIAITPEFAPSIPVNTLKAKFMFRGLSGTSYTCALQVGVMTNPMDANTFVAVDTVYPGSSVATYESREVSFANYTGAGHYIAFKHGLMGGSTYYAMMDNLIIELDSNATPPTPPTCATPTGLTVPASSITQTTATASWNAGGTETAWDLQYKQHNASNWGNAIPLTARTYNFTGLTPGTFYDVRVRANCGNNDVSDWTNAVTFQTQAQGPGPEPCSDPTNLNYTDVGTNSVVLDWTENGTSTSWTVYYQESGTSQWPTVTANEHPYTLTGLQPATTYQAYVVANCDDGPSGVSNLVTFTTQGVGINDYEQTISLYPNPNNGRFTINNEQFIMNNVQVYDVYGKLLKTIEADANTVELDVRELSSGMYFVRISTEKGVVTKSFVKK
ncbi:MAG: fibronectin type III domain-containing protein [Bacteroidales bacterium]|nr:fibronectin type III domain-containing protein [Bacteroidales bacterium]